MKCLHIYVTENNRNVVFDRILQGFFSVLTYVLVFNDLNYFFGEKNTSEMCLT